jgi:hypothetical protein
MAQLGFRNSCVGNTDNVDTTQLNPEGTVSFDQYGNEYIYLPGVASTVAGSWVTVVPGSTVGTTFATRLLLKTHTGRVAVAMAATVASTWGWYQVYGWNSNALAGSDGTIVSGGGEIAGSSLAGAPVLYAAATSAAAAAGEKIRGAFTYSGQPDSDSAAAGTPGADKIVVFLNYPFVHAADTSFA